MPWVQVPNDSYVYLCQACLAAGKYHTIVPRAGACGAPKKCRSCENIPQGEWEQNRVVWNGVIHCKGIQVVEERVALEYYTQRGDKIMIGQDPDATG